MGPCDAAVILGECLDALLRCPALGPALRQRAKFEGWLKVELAHALEQRPCGAGGRGAGYPWLPGAGGP